jgi:two-component system sensor histidine kinase BaeS
LSAVLLTVLAMGLLNAWNLRNGFSDFLASRDTERLEQFAALVSQNALQADGIERLAATDRGMRNVLHEFAASQGALHNGSPPERPAPGLAGLPPGAPPFSPPPRPVDSMDSFSDRVAVFDLGGQQVMGKRLLQLSQPWIERPVRVRGAVVATVRMLKLKPVAGEVEARFLTSQYQGMLMVAGALLMAALICARWIAAHWVKPLLAMQTATQQIAQGQFGARLSETRADELGDAMRNINHMAQSLQQLEGARRRWIADMSHELYTPLTVLRGEIDGLIDGIIPMQPQALQSLREEVLQLNALVDDLHLLAMADLKALPCYFEDLDAVQLVRSSVERFARRASHSGLDLQMQAPAQEPMPVRWDGKRLEQVLANLLDNSLRYTHPPGLVRAKLWSTASHVHIVLEDSAPGVSEADLSRLFEPLYRADSARTRQAGERAGSGLGLAICQQIVIAHRGSLHASASALGGLCFEIVLPKTEEVSA